MGSATSSTASLTFSCNPNANNNDLLFRTQHITIPGKIFQCQYIDNWPSQNTKICAIIVNQVVWYGVYIIYYDERSNKCIKSKITEICNISNVSITVNNIIECLYKLPTEPWKALYSKFKLKS
eukprot:288903_1